MKKYLKYIIPVLLIAGYYLGRHFYFMPNYHSGDVAYNFTGTQPNGETFELEDLQGNYVLLEFWGSWCGDCRAAHPGLKEIYNTFHNKKFKGADNFEIVGVGLETQKARWLRAIEKDGLNWNYHTVQIADRSSKMFEQPLAKEYGIRWAPSSFLINPVGHIILENPSHREIKTFLEEHLQ